MNIKLVIFITNFLFEFQDDLLAELEELEQEALDEKLLETGGTVPTDLPEVPTAAPASAPRKKQVEEDDDMAELAAWAS